MLAISSLLMSGDSEIARRNILVKPIHPKEEIQIVLKRRLEWIVLFFYKRHRRAAQSEEAGRGARKRG